MEKYLYIIIVYCLIREGVYLYTVHRLINKLMSRNYHEFKTAERLEKPMEMAPRVEQDDPEDLGELNGLSF